MLRRRKTSEKTRSLGAPESSQQIEGWLEAQLIQGQRAWKDPASRPTWRYFCPFCGAPRRLVGSGPRVQRRHVVQVALTSAVAASLLWPLLQWRGLFLFFPFWMVFEVFHRLRVRAQLECPQCGFDPALFLADQQRARLQMRAFWEKKLAGRAPSAESRDGLSPALTAENTER